MFLLVEKVRVVWAPTSNANRWRSPVYIICVVTVALYGVVTALMFYGTPQLFYMLDYLTSFL